jgi:hypothetical protein
VKDDPSKIPIWQTIVGQYRPTFLSRCENAIALSNSFVKEQLANVMFHGRPNGKRLAASIVSSLSHYDKNKTHDRHIHYEECLKLGLAVKLIEDAVDPDGKKDGALQDLILTVHHCYMHTLMNTPIYKIIENHMGVGICKNMTPNAPAKDQHPRAGVD